MTGNAHPAAPAPVHHRRRFFGNPVILKELRGRMRGARAFTVLTVYLTLMSGFMALLYVLTLSARDIYGFTAGGQIGRILYTGIVGIELFLVTFITPAFTAGAISGERERQTYDLLRTTMLLPRSLVVGKLISALSYVMLLLVAAIPLQAIAFLFGGVTETELALAFVILVATAIMLGALGVYFSAHRMRTIDANVTTYAATLAVTIGLPLLTGAVLLLIGPRANTLPLGLRSLATIVLWLLAASNPIAAAVATQHWLLEQQSAGFFALTLTDIPTGMTIQVPLVSPWIPFTLLYLGIAALLVWRTIRRVRRIDG